MEKITWIVVADAGKARIFRTHKASLFTPKKDGKELTLVSEHEHEGSRKKDSELVSDKPGHFGMNSLNQATDPKQHEEERFAIELAKLLSDARNNNHYQDLICIAPPTFMGMINKHLPDNVTKLLSITIEKDYTRQTEHELVQSLQNYL